MDWFFKTPERKTSEFFKGENIFSKLNQSTFGTVTKSLNGIFDKDELNDYQLPKVVVIGNESAGKSCLLENITKCEIFPRDYKTCTKCPIKFRLKTSPDNKASVTFKDTTVNLSDKSSIYSEVNRIMCEIDDIESDEITVDLAGNDIPTFEFYDLPGIVSYPPKKAHDTKQIIKKYISDPNTIILCVVPATVTRLTNQESIALLQEMKREKNSILVLTMSDRVQPQNIPELILLRLLNKSDELINTEFSQCIAVVNRIHTDEYSLEENDNNEKQWFDTNILDKINSEQKLVLESVSSKITIKNLLNNLNNFYSKHIDQIWKPLIIKMIDKKINKLENYVLSIGPLPLSIDKILLNTEIHSALYDYLCNDDHNLDFTVEFTIEDNCKYKYEKEYFQSRDYINNLNKCKFVICKCISDKLYSLFLPIFTNDGRKRKLNRFFKLKNELSEYINKEICALINEHSVEIRDRALGNLKYLKTHKLSHTESYITSIIKKLIVGKLFNQFKFEIIDDMLEEDDIIKQQRNEADYKFNELYSLKTKIQNLII